jgi:hypothetical protein
MVERVRARSGRPKSTRLVAELSELGVRGAVVCDCLLTSLEGGDLALVESLGFDLTLLLQTINNILVTPANLVRKALDSAVLAARLQAKDTKSFRDNHALLAVVWRRNTLKELETLKGCGTTGCLVGDHAADGTEEDLGRGTVMEGAGLFRVHNMAFVEEVVVAELVAEEAARDVDFFTAYDGNLLAIEDLLGDDGGQPTKQMALAVDDNRGRGEGGHR